MDGVFRAAEIKLGHGPKAKTQSAEIININQAQVEIRDPMSIGGGGEYTEKQEVAFDEVTGFYGMKDRMGASHGQREKLNRGAFNEASGTDQRDASEGRTDRSFYK